MIKILAISVLSLLLIAFLFNYECIFKNIFNIPCISCGLTRGFIYVKENQDIVEETKKICLEVIENNIDESNKKVDYTQIKNDVREHLGKYFYKETEAKPMIITVIQEV